MGRHSPQQGAFGAPGYGYDCVTCEAEGRRRGEIEPWERGFIVCPDCGNKRCPKATFHEQACTHSNESGQEGSVYGHTVPARLLQAILKDED